MVYVTFIADVRGEQEVQEVVLKLLHRPKVEVLSYERRLRLLSKIDFLFSFERRRG